MWRTLSIIAVSLFLSSVARADQSPREYTETLLNNFKKLKPESNLSAADKAENKKIVEELDRSFDFDGITTKLMAPRADKFSAKQKAEFKSKFHELVRAGTFIDSSSFFRKAKLDFLPAKETGGVTTVPVHVTVPAEDTDMTVGLQWKKEDGRLKVVDVLIDGDSLVKDYQNQVARLVDKKGVSGVLQAVEERRASAEKAKAK
jgi:phospholipid transport system substrate-binding protein